MTHPTAPDSLPCNSDATTATTTSTRPDSSFLLAEVAMVSGTATTSGRNTHQETMQHDQLLHLAATKQRKREELVSVIENALVIIEQDASGGAGRDKGNIVTMRCLPQ
jgi:hypothetical protein